jgi:hypothetical protein
MNSPFIDISYNDDMSIPFDLLTTNTYEVELYETIIVTSTEADSIVSTAQVTKTVTRCRRMQHQMNDQQNQTSDSDRYYQIRPGG